MTYTSPTIVDYGDVTQVTAQLTNHQLSDTTITAGENLGVQNSTGSCLTGYQISGVNCVAIPPQTSH